jgi:hypothetical protein
VREFDVVIETRHARPLEVGVFEGRERQRPQRRAVEEWLATIILAGRRQLSWPVT